MANAPIRRLELEFIPSNVSGFPYIAKINMIREPGFIGQIDLINVDKFIIDESDIDVVEASEQIMNYIGESVYMSDDTFIGGLEVVDVAKDKSNLKITTVNLKDFRFLLDTVLTTEDLILFSLNYKYNGVEFKTPLVMSYVPVEVKPLTDGDLRPCVTLRNHRFRGPIESDKMDQFNIEVFQDLEYLYESSVLIENNIKSNMDLMDGKYTALYNITEKAKLLKERVLDA